MINTNVLISESSSRFMAKLSVLSLIARPLFVGVSVFCVLF